MGGKRVKSVSFAKNSDGTWSCTVHFTNKPSQHFQDGTTLVDVG